MAFYAEHFNTVEVNSTFYGQPRPEVSRQWVKRTPAGFDFSVKLYQKFTHPKLYTDRVEKALPFAAADAVQALVDVSAADLDQFRRGIEPLAAAGKLGALLAQFPASFKAAPQSRDYVERLLRVFGGLEKGSVYYLHDRVFFIKMDLLAVILLMEIWPMVTLIRWRMQVRRGAAVDTSPAAALARISTVQAVLVVLMVCAATALARGYFH